MPIRYEIYHTAVLDVEENNLRFVKVPNFSMSFSDQLSIRITLSGFQFKMISHPSMSIISLVVIPYNLVPYSVVEAPTINGLF